VIESFVDLTYRGLSLGRRIKLGQVRPSSAYLELAAPMPVGTPVSLTTDDGLTIDATVTWVYEQVAGSERTPGMIVVPALAADPAAAWWTARIALPDDDSPRTRAPRARPVTVRPRSQTLQTVPTVPTPLPGGPVASELPTIVADLDARVAAAAGLSLPRATTEPGGPRTAVMSAVDQAQLEQLARNLDDEPTVRSTDEHIVVDDGHKTIMMDAIDPSALGIDAGGDTDPGASGEAGEAAEVGEAGASGDRGGNGTPSPGGSDRKRRRW
jgi:hypothetical protein